MISCFQLLLANSTCAAKARLAAQAGIEAPAAVAVVDEKGEAGAKKAAEEASPLRRGPPDPEEKAAAARAAAVSAATWAGAYTRPLFGSI